MDKNIFSLKRRGGKLFAAVSAVCIALILALNLLLAYFGLNKTVFIDMTDEGFYTVTDKMEDSCAFIDESLDKPIEITFCADPDTLMANQVTRLVYVMSMKLANKFDNIELKTVNVANDPTSVAMYKTTSMTQIKSDDVIVSYGNKHRIVSSQSFWTTASDKLWSYNGEYKMVSVILSLTAINQPVAYFITGHGEQCYDKENPESADSIKTQSIYELLSERGLDVKILDLSTVNAIPEDCALLVLNNPTSDFTYDPDKLDSFDYVSDLEKIDRYLAKGNGSLMVAKDYAVTLPNLELFLREWGFSFSQTQVKDEGNSLPAVSSSGFAPIIGVYDTEENSYGNAIYGDYAASATSPKMIFSNTGYITSAFGLGETTVEPGADAVNRHYAHFIGTSGNAIAYKYNSDKGEYADPATQKQAFTLAAVASRHYTNETDATTLYSYIFCVNSKDFLSNELLGNPSYANFDVLSAVVNNMIRTDRYASNDLGGTSLNSSSFGGKQIIDATLYEYATTIYSTDATLLEVIKENEGINQTDIAIISVFVFAIPVIIACVGIAVCLKRKFL